MMGVFKLADFMLDDKPLRWYELGQREELSASECYLGNQGSFKRIGCPL